MKPELNRKCSTCDSDCKLRGKEMDKAAEIRIMASAIAYTMKDFDSEETARILAITVATWIASHIVDTETHERILNDHTEAVRKMIPEYNKKIMELLPKQA